MTPRKQLCLCADDFGLDAGIDSGILSLVERGRLQAVSCMTTGAHWEQGGAGLMSAGTSADIGLHFCLTRTHAVSGKHPALAALLAKSTVGLIDGGWVLAELQQQWDNFVRVAGKQPAFVDGHQHVHQLRDVREVLTAFLQRHGFNGWVRNLAQVQPSQGVGALFKGEVLKRLGARAWQQQAIANGWNQHTAFGGVYGFDDRQPYHELMQHWMRSLPSGSLVMCHPADPAMQASDNAFDPIRAARLREFRYLSSDDFEVDSEKADVIWRKSW